MLTIYETDEAGTTKVWDVNAGSCPECGANSSFDIPRTPATPMRVLCFSCGYAKGYDFLQTDQGS